MRQSILPNRRGDREAEGAALEMPCGGQTSPRVRIPPSPLKPKMTTRYDKTRAHRVLSFVNPSSLKTSLRFTKRFTKPLPPGRMFQDAALNGLQEGRPCL